MPAAWPFGPACPVQSFKMLAGNSIYIVKNVLVGSKAVLKVVLHLGLSWYVCHVRNKCEDGFWLHFTI